MRRTIVLITALVLIAAAPVYAQVTREPQPKGPEIGVACPSPTPKPPR